MSDAITLRAPAKVNLALRVLAREASGYHHIETVFQKLSLADVVAVRLTSGARALTVTWDQVRTADLGPVEQNLAWRAAVAFGAATGWVVGWDIHITKRIPAGGGLGGGSADAAAVLRALNALHPAPLSHDALGQIGATLGADVPFLVHPHARALGTARGDHVVPLAPLPTAPVLLVLPPFGVHTGAAYGALAAARAAAGGSAPTAQYSTTGWDSWDAVAARQHNDFEATVFAEHPALAVVLHQLRDAGAQTARMSGSGSTLFGVWPPGAELPALTLPDGWDAVPTGTE